MTHPWHDVSPGKRTLDNVNAVIEISRGGTVKYELDKPTGMLRMDRVLYSAVHFPANYGFIPQSLGEDHDPLDILVLCQFAVHPMTLIEARPIGVMTMVDAGRNDHKIIAVAVEDPEYNTYRAIDQLPEHRLRTITRFFRDYKTLEKAKVDVQEVNPSEQACEVIDQAIDRYRDWQADKREMSDKRYVSDERGVSDEASA